MPAGPGAPGRGLTVYLVARDETVRRGLVCLLRAGKVRAYALDLDRSGPGMVASPSHGAAYLGYVRERSDVVDFLLRVGHHPEGPRLLLVDPAASRETTEEALKAHAKVCRLPLPSVVLELTLHELVEGSPDPAALRPATNEGREGAVGAADHPPPPKLAEPLPATRPREGGTFSV